MGGAHRAPPCDGGLGEAQKMRGGKGICTAMRWRGEGQRRRGSQGAHVAMRWGEKPDEGEEAGGRRMLCTIVRWGAKETRRKRGGRVEARNYQMEGEKAEVGEGAGGGEPS